jgi:hypothetical protein
MGHPLPMAAQKISAALPTGGSRLFSAAFSPSATKRCLGAEAGGKIEIDCYAFENAVPQSAFV